MAAQYQDLGGKRFYWDGRTYADQQEAEQAAEGYRADGFEAQVVEGPEGHLVYSRRQAQA
jgi:hypothetical protein